MRTHIEIDDDVMAAALRAGPFQTKKDAVEAGLRLLARQARYREVLGAQGRLKWEGEAWADEPEADVDAAWLRVAERRGRYEPVAASPRSGGGSRKTAGVKATKPN